jgi:ABC-type dipeptide/oligopeptide/nickel transport system permease subunit
MRDRDYPSPEREGPRARHLRRRRVGPVAGGLVGGCAAAFFGVSELMGRHATDAVVALPVIAGLLMLCALVAHEWRTEDPLIPVRSLAHTIPVAAIVVAMTAGCASVAVVQLA